MHNRVAGDGSLPHHRAPAPGKQLRATKVTAATDAKAVSRLIQSCLSSCASSCCITMSSTCFIAHVPRRRQKVLLRSHPQPNNAWKTTSSCARSMLLSTRNFPQGEQQDLTATALAQRTRNWVPGCDTTALSVWWANFDAAECEYPCSERSWSHTGDRKPCC